MGKKEYSLFRRVGKTNMVSLIIVNYNGEKTIIDCLRSIEKQTYDSYEIIIIDNASQDKSLEMINVFLKRNKLSSQTKIICLDKNTGFALGNNVGLEHAHGDFIALLNNDAMPDVKWLEELLLAMSSDASVGICASKILIHGTNKIDSAGDGYTTSLKGFKRGEEDIVDKYNLKEFIFSACAGAALYRREVFEETGFLDEDFFLIHEDTDLNFRAQLAGWKALYVPTAIAYHKARFSIGKMSDMAVYHTLRNIEFVRMKDVPLGIFFLCLPEFVLGVLSEFIYFAIKHGFFKLYMKAKIDALKMMPMMFKKRKLIMKTKKVDNRYLLRIMTPIWQKDFFRSKLKKFLYD